MVGVIKGGGSRDGDLSFKVGVEPTSGLGEVKASLKGTHFIAPFV
jgi:hypothetical protein